MPDLADLPPELLDHILNLAFGITPQYDWDHGVLDTLDVKPLSRLLLVSRRWRHALLTRVYSKWTYNGARHSYSSLWKFLRAVLTSPELAATVRVLNIGNWGVCPPTYLQQHIGLEDKKLRFSPQDRELVSKAIHQAGISHLESDILEGVSDKCDRRPLVTLLLTCLSNVSTVYAHVPASDPFLRAVLNVALDQQRSSCGSSSVLGCMKELYLLSEVPGFTPEEPALPDEDITEPPLRLDDVWPVFYLEQLRTLYLYNLDTDGAASLLQEKGTHECHIQQLHIATKQTATCTPEDVTALLTLPQALTSLSLSWSGDKSKVKDKISGKKRNIWKISNHEVWTALQKYQDTLEYLDVFHETEPGSHQNRTTNHFKPLTQFSKLRYLSTLSEVLIGGYSDQSIAPFRLNDALPPNLESLVLSVGISAETIPDLPSQLQEVVSGQRPHFKSLHLSDGAAVNIYRPPDVTPEKYQPVEETCARTGVRFDIRLACNSVVILPNCPFPAGARCVRVWRKTYNLRAEGIMRRLTAKRRAAQIEAGLSEPSEPESEAESDPEPATARDLTTHVVPFTDHSGTDSFMVFESSTPLPPLVQFAIYFTHPETPANPEATDLPGLHDTIRALMDDFHFRLDVYFLPGATDAECIAHYQAEKAVRGDSMRMLQEAEERVNQGQPAPSPPRLPGMIDVFQSDDGARLGGVLCINPQRDWREGEQRMCCVLFEPEFESPAPVITEWRGLTKESPGHGEDDEVDTSLDQWMWEFAAHFREEAQGGFYMARERGWTSW